MAVHGTVLVCRSALLFSSRALPFPMLSVIQSLR